MEEALGSQFYHLTTKLRPYSLVEFYQQLSESLFALSVLFVNGLVCH